MACHITICMGSSCFSRGNRVNLEILEDFIAKHHLDATIDLVGSRCTGKCAAGPVICIDETLYQHVDSGMLIDLLERQFTNS